MEDIENKVKTLIMLLSNATGAEFEDEDLAAEIIEETIRRTVKQVLEDKRDILNQNINNCRDLSKSDVRIIINHVLK